MIYVVQAFILMGAITFFERAAPFFVLGRFQDHPHIAFLGKFLPATAMVILVIYCLKDISVIDRPYGLPELIGIAVVAALHLFKRNALLSILGGTSFYVALLHWL